MPNSDFFYRRLKALNPRRSLSLLTALVLTFTSVFVISPAELFAAPVVEAPVASPRSLPPAGANQVLITVRVVRAGADPLVVPNGVYLYQVDAAGKNLAKLGTMHDDGTNGDAAAGDDILSLLINIVQPPQNGFRVQASVAFQRVVRRSLSPVTIIPVGVNNQPPAFTTTAPDSALETELYFYSVKAVDPEGSPVTYDLLTAPDGMTIKSATRPGTTDKATILEWTPKKNQKGPNEVKIKARDPQNAEAVQSFTVNVDELNLSPVFTTVPPSYAKTAQKYVYDCDAYDPEKQPLVFNFSGVVPNGMTINHQSCLIEWTPGTADIKQHEIKITAVDPSGASTEQTYTLDVYDGSAALQLISPAGDYTVAAGQTLQLPFQSNFANALFSGEPLPENSELNQQFFKFIPNNDQVGTHTIAFEAKAADQNVSNIVTIHVTKTNTAPVIDSIPLQTVNEGEELSVLVTATDAEEDPLVFTAPALSLENAYFNENTHEFHFTPSFDQAGEYNIVIQVSDGTANPQATFHVTVKDAPPPAQDLNLVVDPTPNPTFKSSLPITGNVVGLAGGPAGPEKPSYVSVLGPASGKQNQTLDVDLTGSNTHFEEGKSTADFGEGVTVQKLQIFSGLSAKASIVISKNADIGPRIVKIITESEEAFSIVAFNVEKGSAKVKGKVVDEFTDQPIQGARVSINGTNLFTLADVSGNFILENVPQGNQSILITKPNFTVGTVNVLIDDSDDLQLQDLIKLRALARPASLGGVLPRAATVASVLDRGVTKKDGKYTLDQAKALVNDTMIAVGGTEAGVVDEAGKQLNPNVNGFGAFTLTQDGVESQAKSLMIGEAVTLKDFVAMLQSAFSFPFGLSVNDVINGFQEAANEAWANPSDPSNAMALVLFNEGVTLSTEVPIITEGTRFNRFQMFLLCSSFMVYNARTLDASSTALLQLNGIDAKSKLPTPPFSPLGSGGGSGGGGGPGGLSGDESKSTLKKMISVLDWFIPSAEASMTSTPSCQKCGTRDLIGNRTFTKVYAQIGANIVAESAHGALVAAGIAVAQQAFIGYMMGVSGGRLGAAAAVLQVAGAAAMGFAATAFFKAVLGWYIAFAASSFEPAPVLGTGEKKDADGNYVIKFERSTTDVQARRAAAAEPDAEKKKLIRKNFAYLLYRFPNCQVSPSASDGELMPLEAIEEPGHPNNQKDPHVGPLRFVVPITLQKDGENCFRVRTIQFIKNAERDLVEGISLYDTNNDHKVSLEEFQRGGLGDRIGFSGLDQNKDGFLDSTEYKKVTAPSTFQVNNNAPQTPYQAYLGRIDLSPDAYKSLSNQKNQEFNTAFPASRGKEQIQANVIKKMLNEMQIPDAAFLEDNKASIALGDDVFEEARIKGNELSKLPRPEGREKLKTVAEEIAKKLYQEHLGVAPKPDQVARVQDILTKHWEHGTRRAQLKEFIQANHSVGDAIHKIQDGLETEVKVRIPVAFDDPYKTGAPITDVEGDVYLLNPLKYEEVTINASNLQQVDDDFTFPDKAVAAGREAEPTVKSRFLFESMSSFLGPGSLGDFELISAPREAGPDNTGNAVLETDKLVKDAISQKTGLTPDEVTAKTKQFFNNRNSTAVDAQALQNQYAEISEITDSKVRGLNEFIREEARVSFGTKVQRPAGLSPFFEKGIGQISNVAGGYISGSWFLLAFLDSIRIIESDFSDSCWSVIRPNIPVPTETFPPTFEPHPSLYEVSAVLVGKNGPKVNVRGELKAVDGFLQKEYPGDHEFTTASSTGFPPGYISIDNQGRVYAINMNSTELYGGRIFRYKLISQDPLPDKAIRPFAMEREFVGAINYFSQMIQLARPALPITMTVGPSKKFTNAQGQQGDTQDLFVANLDLKDSKKQIMRIPVSQIDTIPNVYGELAGVPGSQGNRHRLVGQVLIDDSNLKLTGPSDMELGPDPAFPDVKQTENSVIMFSDEEVIYAIIHNPGDTFGLKKIIEIPGHRWSGLAFDKVGNFYFADYLKGSVYALTWQKLRELISGTVIISSDDELKTSGFEVATGIDGPGDIELEAVSAHPGSVLHVSTFAGILPITLPIVGVASSSIREVRLDLFNTEVAGKIDGVHHHFSVTPARDQLFKKSVVLRIRSVDAGGHESWKEQSVALSENGATILTEPLA